MSYHQLRSCQPPNIHDFNREEWDWNGYILNNTWINDHRTFDIFRYNWFDFSWHVVARGDGMSPVLGVATPKLAHMLAPIFTMAEGDMGSEWYQGRPTSGIQRSSHNVEKTRAINIHKPTIWGWYLPPMYGDIRGGLWDWLYNIMVNLL